jgi:hypothetical protein
MAKPGTTRRGVLGAAASIPFLPLAPVRADPAETKSTEGLPPSPAPSRETWDRNLARYQSLAARAKKAEETGWFRAANERFYREMAEPTADRQAAFARMTRAENLFWHRCTAPMQEAAVTLVLTPPLGLEGLRNKLAIVRTHQLYEPKVMERECFEVLEEDVWRLLAGPSRSL